MSSEKVRKWGAGGVRVVCWVPAAFVDLPRSCAGATLLAGHVGLGSLRLVSVRRFALAYCRFGAAAAVRPRGLASLRARLFLDLGFLTICVAWYVALPEASPSCGEARGGYESHVPAVEPVRDLRVRGIRVPPIWHVYP